MQVHRIILIGNLLTHPANALTGIEGVKVEVGTFKIFLYGPNRPAATSN
jgi:uncharacterized protein YegP (UPF0339 family)